MRCPIPSSTNLRATYYAGTGWLLRGSSSVCWLHEIAHRAPPFTRTIELQNIPQGVTFEVFEAGDFAGMAFIQFGSGQGVPYREEELRPTGIWGHR